MLKVNITSPSKQQKNRPKNCKQQKAVQGMMAGPPGEDQCDGRATIWRGKIRPSAEPPICREFCSEGGAFVNPFIYAGLVVLPGKCRNHFRPPLSLLVRKWRPG
uniref:(northern house mosquito) hypothetical protein n=1 Tax=Culex pipiens TaxID=7175 RepID=A0A8D8FUX5_CULPI